MSQQSKKRKIRLGFLRGISSVDKILIVAMLILFVQFLILLTEDPSPGTESIDVAFRSAAAMIFGYFIGGIDTNTDSYETTDAVSKVVLKGDSGEAPTAKIGFTSESAASPPASQDDRPPQITRLSEHKTALQVWVAGGIALLSILVLLMARNIHIFYDNLSTDSGIATLSQLRDFATGSIGFLVSANKKV